MAADGANQGLDRAASVLEAITRRGPSRVADIVTETGLSQSTVSRLLTALERLEYVVRDPDAGTYRLGLIFLAMAGSALNEQSVFRHARQPGQQLAAALGLGVNVAIRRGNELYYLCNFEGTLAPKNFTLMGQRSPLHSTALGKCLLAGLSGPERRELLPDLEPFTVRTIVDHEALDDAVTAVDRGGYATEREELALGRSCVAAPIRDSGGLIVAAISISGPLSALDLSSRELEIAQRAIEVADSISTGMGYLGPRSSSQLPQRN
ncbi:MULTISPECIES: IclR family transcriptional regulator [Pseudoclavibacter]|uniref:IclR family transcriptional regulator n=1 Tax=Pseudoclavibacter TaxID=255204 RepID=UPI000CE833CE|nr:MULTISPECIES: IclR family transcriptional regulator [Pseudoclavibacter]PPG40618.1 IclR family transcriptional regulator [Pseudoclavibacter sp. RFBA6]